MGHEVPDVFTELPPRPQAPWATLLLLPSLHLTPNNWLARFALDMAWAYQDVAERDPTALLPA